MNTEYKVFVATMVCMVMCCQACGDKRNAEPCYKGIPHYEEDDMIEQYCYQMDNSICLEEREFGKKSDDQEEEAFVCRCGYVPLHSLECGEGYGDHSVCCVYSSHVSPDKCVTPGHDLNCSELGKAGCCECLKEVSVRSATYFPLSYVSMDNPLCLKRTGQRTCTACGDGECQELWEDECNCPEDCDGRRKTLCGSGHQDCPDGTFCLFPDETCGIGVDGICMPFAKCDEQYKMSTDEPVCGCNNVTYDWICAMWEAGTPLQHTGACTSQ